MRFLLRRRRAEAAPSDIAMPIPIVETPLDELHRA